MYKISAAIFILPLPFFKRLAHDFWLLENVHTREVVAQLHGFATSRHTGKIVPIGYSRAHTLAAYHIVLGEDFAKKNNFSRCNLKWALPTHKTYCVYRGNDTLDRWLEAVKAIDGINQLDLNYPPGGISFPLKSTVNSNTIYRTFAEIMGIEPYAAPYYIHIGLEKSLKLSLFDCKF